MKDCCKYFWKQASISKVNEFNPIPSIVCTVCHFVCTEEEYFKLLDEMNHAKP